MKKTKKFYIPKDMSKFMNKFYIKKEIMNMIDESIDINKYIEENFSEYELVFDDIDFDSIKKEVLYE